ncbi:MAG TPA: nuclear transport factor 2 family protein [Acidobacteriota bacterium]|nr:nuclear transport factor 2 family protein [Acidobacteriota bacterium]
MHPSGLLIVGLLVVACGVAWTAAGGEDGWPAALRELVASERAFARAADEGGIRAAFLSFLAPEGVVFRPRPVPGRPAYEQMPADATALLAWRPVFAETSASGDLGYTTGPWYLKNRRQDPDPSGWGHYVSIWRRGEGGRWTVLLDAGIRHGRADHLPDTVTTAKSGQPAHLGEIPFSDLDAEISRLAAVSGPAAAFRQLASPDLRFYRDRALPVIGRDRSLALLPAAPAAWTWRAEGQAGSADGSLGYSYGILETQAAAGGARPALQHSYLHIWRRGGDGYRLVLDLAVAIPVAPAS